MEYMFSLFCKTRKILIRGIKAVVGIDTKLKIYMDYTNENEQEPNENNDNDNNDNPRTVNDS